MNQPCSVKLKSDCIIPFSDSFENNRNSVWFQKYNTYKRCDMYIIYILSIYILNILYLSDIILIKDVKYTQDDPIISFTALVMCYI